MASAWSTLRDVLKRVVTSNCESREAEAINRKLDTITHYCTCTNNQVRVNEMVKTLEDNYIASKDILKWFVVVLKDRAVNRSDLVGEIEKKIKHLHGTG